MNRKQILTMLISLSILALIFLYISVLPDLSNPSLGLPSESPVLEGSKMQVFSLDTLVDFFQENMDSFERLRTEVSENNIPFQLTIWRGEISISSTEKSDICESDIVGFKNIISDMKILNIVTVYYFEIDPTKMTLIFEYSDGATLYISYGRSEDEIFGQLFGCIPLYDQWLAYAMVAE